MPNRLHFWRASWTLLDQGIVSAGTFAVNIVLARQMAPGEYGVFVLLYGGLLTLQLFNATLLFHPLSVRLVVADREDQPRLMCASLLLVGLLSSALGVVLTLLLFLVGRPYLVLPALICFLTWQLQEAMRRGLLTSFRHRAAIPGDAVSYLGQVLLAVALALTHSLTLASVLYAMAATSAAAAVIQAWQLKLKANRSLRLHETIADYWRIGGFWSLGNGLLAQVRGFGLPWVLAASGGPAAVAGFQAASNIVNLSNPIVIGLCNIIPQTASQASVNGNDHAWRATREYVRVVVPFLLLWSTLVLIVPGTILGILYGSQSDYSALTAPLRMLIIGGLAACAADIILSYLHGISAPRLAFSVNGIGALVVLLLAWPMIYSADLNGACITVVIVNVVRLVAARIMLARSMEAPWHSMNGNGWLTTSQASNRLPLRQSKARYR